MSVAAQAILPADLGLRTEVVRRRYDRIAPFYDVGEALPELRMRGWRRQALSRVGGGRVLEVGVGTGKSMPFYPPGADVSAIDLSPRMVERAMGRARAMGREVHISVADVQALPHPDASFDTAFASFVFCSVPDARRGLDEIRRILRPGGRLVLLEHVLSRRGWLRRLMRWLDPLPYRIWGAHIDRDTVDTVRAAGFVVEEDIDLALDIVKIIVARAPTNPEER